MSFFSILKLSDKTQNGLLWGTLFGITAIPLQAGIYFNFIKNLNVSKEFKHKLNQETFKLLSLTTSLLGFMYGYNTSRKLINYFITNK